MKLKTILFTMLVALGGHVYACKCNDPTSVKESFETTAVVVHGKVISVEIVSFASTMKEEKTIELKERLKKDDKKLRFFESDYIFKIRLEVMKASRELTSMIL